MTGSRKKTREDVLAAAGEPPPGGDFVWDGEDEDERPATEAELQVGIAAARKRGRGPQKAPTKERISLRVSTAVLSHFRAGGPGWQSRINAALEKLVEDES
ncbi:BrnA antitoxin family protein [Zavarzinia compransoris]|uniref:BrnA antitoxin family protein n=1 Tax=Zavarzinia compransoris TaxID=1264899 RepID=A0A317E048_9PROT|nr:BrnA antitoxin family protein [Zavarzinia compransoris]PWR19804.1 hypothetical protein DKG75_15200 [Zavarzinia compransoris]TDP45091.1 BrnA antitoxin of type II toxin-antitoxin system [Zavarzinia compransoris]